MTFLINVFSLGGDEKFGYKVYALVAKEVIKSRDIIFFEDRF